MTEREKAIAGWTGGEQRAHDLGVMSALIILLEAIKSVPAARFDTTKPFRDAFTQITSLAVCGQSHKATPEEVEAQKIEELTSGDQA